MKCKCGRERTGVRCEDCQRAYMRGYMKGKRRAKKEMKVKAATNICPVCGELSSSHEKMCSW